MNIKIIITTLLLLIVAALFGYNMLFIKYVAETKQEISYDINVEFGQAKKVMALTDILEEVISSEQGEIVSKDWKKMIVSGNRPLRDGLNIDATCEFIISKKDPDLGQIKLKMKQDTQVDNKRIHSVVDLIEPVDHLKNLQTTMTMQPKGNITTIKTSIYMKYCRVIPRFMIEEVNKKINDSAINTLNSNKDVITNIISKYGKNKIIIPIKPKK
jgi:hypothetical protein